MAKVNPLEQASTRQVAQAFGITEEAVLRWRDNIPEADKVWTHEKGKGKGIVRWSLPKVIAWKIARAAEAKASAPATTRPLTPIEQEQLRRLKRENDQRDEKLVDKQQLEIQWAKVGSELRGRLEAIGRRHGAAVANDIARAMADLGRSMHGLVGKPT
jgi:transposase-like protein